MAGAACSLIVYMTTCSGGGDPYYNWLTQSRLDSVADQSSSSVDSSLLFTVGRGPSRPRRATKQPPVGPDFGKDRLGTGAATDQVDGAGMLLMASVVIYVTVLSAVTPLFGTKKVISPTDIV